MKKILTFAIPSYNSEAYMRKCIDSLLPGGEDVEILIVNDGSKDGTAVIADEYAVKYPTIVRAIHQENKGHGGAVNAGIEHATGMYFKVVDSDDWADLDSYMQILETLKGFRRDRKRVDLLIANYVYEHAEDQTSHTVSYAKVLPQNKIFGWKEVRRFRMDQNLLMHSVFYRTKVLRNSGLKLPEHTFYVDNLFVYVPLPYVKTLYYMDVDFYRYFIGRSDQSVNEQIMIGRIDQQIKVNKMMISAYDLPDEVAHKELARYMLSYLSMICTVTSMLLMVSGTEENEEKRKALWADFKQENPKMYRRVRFGFRGLADNPVGPVTRKMSIGLYRIAQKIFKFN